MPIHGYVYKDMHIGYVYMAMYLWLCIYGHAFMAMYVWLCKHGYVYTAMYL